ncbi:MAG: Nramp family divalent metal transporter [Cyclobacteriaceae bacterium]|nr:Nramp family divalent metal transporter [Cyclobacteriaceae bacterium HetDA_MAG_MS6]
MFRKKLPFGPALLVTAAFIGPGTIITASVSGAKFGYSLLWALLFSTLATIVLQEMTARLGTVGKISLSEAIRTRVNSKWQFLSIILVSVAIVIGNAAYQSGNVIGASIGLSSLIGQENSILFSLFVGLVAFLVLFNGNYQAIERILIACVAIMSIGFLFTLIILPVDWFKTLKGLLVPSLPIGAGLQVMALIGTTIVPYNLFLHAATVKEKWPEKESLPAAKKDVIISVMIGGIISMAILMTSATTLYDVYGAELSLATLSKQLEPLLGASAVTFLSLGILAAGLTSSITAPLAAAYAITGVCGIDQRLKSWSFRLVWIGVLAIGVLFASLGLRPLWIIQIAQFANGLILPLIGIFLVFVMNSKKLLGDYRNGLIANLLGSLVLLVLLLLGIRSILLVLNII